MGIQYYLRILGARKKLILSVTVVAFVGSVLLALIWPNSFESSVRVHVQSLPSPTEEVTGLYYSQGYYRQLIAQYEIETYSEIVQGQEFASRISKIIDEQFGVQLTPKVISESLRSDQKHRILELTFTSSDAEIAQALAYAAQTIFETQAGDYSPSVRQGLVSVQIVDPASEPEAASLVRLGLDVFARTLVAFLLITGVAFILEVQSGLSRSREDIEETHNLPVLATIPTIVPPSAESAQDSPKTA